MAGSNKNVTEMLQAVVDGDRGAAEKLLPLVYDVLRRLAQKQMAGQPSGQTLQPTALVHEAYLRLFAAEELSWTDRSHFFAAAAQAMRQILVDRARRRLAPKHGGDRARMSLAQVEPASEELPPEQFLALDEALSRLDQVDHRKAQIVLLRYFSGLTIQQTAQSLKRSPATVKREWRFAKAWLYREMICYDQQ